MNGMCIIQSYGNNSPDYTIDYFEAVHLKPYFSGCSTNSLEGNCFLALLTTGRLPLPRAREVSVADDSECVYNIRATARYTAVATYCASLKPHAAILCA
eukprot:6049214-Pleurochrysis_carterae.AAC.4